MSELSLSSGDRPLKHICNFLSEIIPSGIGKKLGFELISLTSGLSSSKSVYIVDEVQGIEFYPPVGWVIEVLLI